MQKDFAPQSIAYCVGDSVKKKTVAGDDGDWLSAQAQQMTHILCLRPFHRTSPIVISALVDVTKTLIAVIY